MRFSLAALTVALAAACGPSPAAPDSLAATQMITAPAENTRVIAVLSYASWCGSCKALDPKVTAVQASTEFEGVEFAALDYSAKDVGAFYADAATLGIENTLRTKFTDGIKTGKLYLISTETGAILAEIDKSMDNAAISAAIQQASADT